MYKVFSYYRCEADTICISLFANHLCLYQSLQLQKMRVILNMRWKFMRWSAGELQTSCSLRGLIKNATLHSARYGKRACTHCQCYTVPEKFCFYLYHIQYVICICSELKRSACLRPLLCKRKMSCSWNKQQSGFSLM